MERAWIAQWRVAAVELADQRRRELRGLSAEAALAASNALLSLAATIPVSLARIKDSGLVRQQELLHRRRR
jgi:hypothetical protein